MYSTDALHEVKNSTTRNSKIQKFGPSIGPLVFEGSTTTWTTLKMDMKTRKCDFFLDLNLISCFFWDSIYLSYFKCKKPSKFHVHTRKTL